MQRQPRVPPSGMNVADAVVTELMELDNCDVLAVTVTMAQLMVAGGMDTSSMLGEEDFSMEEMALAVELLCPMSDGTSPSNQALSPPHSRPRAPAVALLKSRRLPLLSQLCAVQRASNAVPGRPLARPSTHMNCQCEFSR